MVPYTDCSAATEPAWTLGKGGRQRFYVLVPVFSSCSNSCTHNGCTYSCPYGIIWDNPFFPGMLVFFFLGWWLVCVHLVCIYWQVLHPHTQVSRQSVREANLHRLSCNLCLWIGCFPTNILCPCHAIILTLHQACASLCCISVVGGYEHMMMVF